MWLKFLSHQRKVYGNKYKESKAKFEELLNNYLLKKLIGQESEEKNKSKKPLEHWPKQIKQKKKQNQKSYVIVVNVTLQK